MDPEVKKELDNLYSEIITLAKMQLMKEHVLRPFAMVLNKEGKTSMIMAQSPKQELRDEYNLLEEGLKKDVKSKKIISVGICVDVLFKLPGTNKKSDALEVRLERFSGESISVFLPYTKVFFRGYTFGKPVANKRIRSIFVSNISIN